jgi:hypothetical protein
MKLFDLYVLFTNLIIYKFLYSVCYFCEYNNMPTTNYNFGTKIQNNVS